MSRSDFGDGTGAKVGRIQEIVPNTTRIDARYRPTFLIVKEKGAATDEVSVHESNNPTTLYGTGVNRFLWNCPAVPMRPRPPTTHE